MNELTEYHVILRLVTAAALGLIIGLERAYKHKAASFKTFALISMGSCLFTLLSVINSASDSMRIASNIVTGVGFLGAGTIMKNNNKVEGITTGAMVWLTASLGMTCGFGYILVAWAVVSIYYLVLFTSVVLHKLVDKISP